MCLYPKLIRNPKYQPNKKNGGHPPIATDPRVLLVPIGCQRCIECLQKKAREWKVRLIEDIRHHKHAQFVTLTFNTESLQELTNEVHREFAEHNDGDITDATGYTLDNLIVTKAVQRFKDRWRKQYGKAMRYWLISELGHGTTEHVHIHGFIYSEDKQRIKDTWGYGFTFIGSYVNEITVNYCVKYVTKLDAQHKAYIPKLLCSDGIGREYKQRIDAQMNKYNPKKGTTREYYTTRSGTRLALPIYLRNKIYSERERELLWLEKLDKMERWVCGTKVDLSKPDGDAKYIALRDYHRKRAKRLGYSEPLTESEKQYENQRRWILQQTRLAQHRNKKSQTTYATPKNGTTKK